MWLCSWTASQVFAQAAKSARWRLSWDTGMGITSWNTYRRFQENVTHQTGMESLHGASLLWSVLFVTVAAMVAGAAHCLLPGLGIPQMGLPGWGWVALAVLAMMLGFSGVLVSTMVDLPDATRWTLVVL